MRRTLASLLVAAAAVATLGTAAPANAVCGGGQPGEPCYCPSGITVPVIKKTIPTGINC